MGHEETIKKIELVTDTLVREFNPEKVILFGSWAWGNPTADSDVDLFVIKDTEDSTRELAREINGSISPRPFPIDVIVYRPEQVEASLESGNFFIEDIITNGRILYDRQTKE